MVHLNDIKYSTEFFSISFSGKNMKDAYLKACKWYATNVLSKDELHNIEVMYEKDKQSPTVTLHLFATLYEQSLIDEHCDVCKSAHNALFCSSNTNCEWCKIHGYRNRLNQKMSIKKEYYKEKIKRNL